jgi:hypothetical protein
MVNGQRYESVKAAWRALKIGTDEERRTFRPLLRAEHRKTFVATDGRRFDFEVLP